MYKWGESMTDSAEPFPLSLEIQDEPEATEDLLQEIQNRHNNLNERVISLKAITDTIKSKISLEKTLWLQELNETVKLEKQLKERRESLHSLTALKEDEYKRKLEVFKDFLFFSQTSDNLKKILRENGYKQWLNDISDDCSSELDKISQSLTALKPLKKIVSQWNVQSEADSGISENRGDDSENVGTVDHFYGFTSS
ncbi:uncharacterized protein [Leptinotarsa decemlineata]|uniref:uncharacterized protein n=1 Tax=Leptinotarsa decemlineata TaxID=7539 RepID=UPI003D30C214